MRLPPHTPRQVLKALADQPDVRLRIARGWILIGSLGLAFIGAMAIAHYAFEMPVHDRNTGQLSTPGNTLSTMLIIGGGMALFLVLGIMLHRWKPDRTDDL